MKRNDFKETFNLKKQKIYNFNLDFKWKIIFNLLLIN